MADIGRSALDRILDDLAQHAPIGQPREDIVPCKRLRVIFGVFAGRHLAAQMERFAHSRKGEREAHDEAEEDDAGEPVIQTQPVQEWEQIELDADQPDAFGDAEQADQLIELAAAPSLVAATAHACALVSLRSWTLNVCQS